MRQPTAGLNAYLKSPRCSKTLTISLQRFRQRSAILGQLQRSPLRCQRRLLDIRQTIVAVQQGKLPAHLAKSALVSIANFDDLEQHAAESTVADFAIVGVRSERAATTPANSLLRQIHFVQERSVTGVATETFQIRINVDRRCSDEAPHHAVGTPDPAIRKPGRTHREGRATTQSSGPDSLPR